MKFIKFAALILSVTLLTCILPACGEVVTVPNVRLGVITVDTKGKETAFISTMAADIKSTDGEAPTVLDAVIQILEENGISYKLDSNGESIRTIKSKSESTRNGYAYYWEFTVNGKAGKRAGEMTVNENDIIVYSLIPSKSASSADDTSEEGEDTEEIVDDNTDEEIEEADE